jgi:hypothetical protein
MNSGYLGFRVELEGERSLHASLLCKVLRATACMFMFGTCPYLFSLVTEFICLL